LLGEKAPEKKRGIRDVIMALVAVALIVSPSYVGWFLMSRVKLSISIVALVSLAIFLVGAFLIVNLLKE
jgi:hypothetical protein